MEIAVIGGGVFGLTAAYQAAREGWQVTLYEETRIGAGASGGVVGALAPHTPDQWNPKKQFQFEALDMAERFWRGVAETGGRNPGYGRIGRLQPLLDDHARSLAEARIGDAAENWGAAYRWEVLAADAHPDLIAPEAAPGGLLFDSLSGRIYPARACASLASACRALGVKIMEEAKVTAVADDHLVLGGQTRRSDAIILAAGVESFALLTPLLGASPGKGVKGQAALLDARLDAPVISGDGLYVIPHAGGVGVGSTSENSYTDLETDTQLDEVIARAKRLCPALRGAPVIEKWAGLRPKAKRRDPLVDHVGGRLWVMSGGFKIGFGVAPLLATRLTDEMAGRESHIPPRFRLAFHMQ
ncbi:NAD(P)/FAD-dependent oxidoreductase [Paracoccaceae bacterium GXU_MW_L88]